VLFGFAAIAAFCLDRSLERASAQAPDVVVDATAPRQTMEGFGATHNPQVYEGLGDVLGPLRAPAVDAVYGQVQLNTGNLEGALLESPGSYDRRTNDNDDPFAIRWPGF